MRSPLRAQETNRNTMNQEIKAVCEEIDQLLEKIKREKQLVDNTLTVHIQELYCQLEIKRAVLARLKLQRLEKELGEQWKQEESIG